MERKCSSHNRLLCRNGRKSEVAEANPCVNGRVHSSKGRRMRILVSPTTGGHLDVSVSPLESVRGLKNVLARKYRLSPSRINLLFKDRVLKDGSLQDNQVTEGSRLVLCPNMESGTSASHTEHSVIQALKNLSESQIHDFLTGKSPLTLAIRLNDHLMFVQLQLSTSSSRPLTLQSSPSPAPPSSSAGGGGAGRVGEGGAVLVPGVNPVSLLQASHNLTQKLRELTRLTHTSLQRAAMPPTPPPSPPPSPGAVIDSMHHVGKGVYSGTFSGTLDPRLQDNSGQPRRDVNTILHILHDLLVAQPGATIAPVPPPSPPPSSPDPAPQASEEAAMRDKVQRLQRQLEQQRQRRSARVRRQNQRPYPSPASLRHPPFLPPTPASHADNAETSNFRKPSMEQETVAV